jgi:hypothetical protein
MFWHSLQSKKMPDVKAMAFRLSAFEPVKKLFPRLTK